MLDRDICDYDEAPTKPRGRNICYLNNGRRQYCRHGINPYPPVPPSTDWWLAGGVAPTCIVAAYQPLGAVDLAASYINLANPGTYDAAPGVAPTHNPATGWTFDGMTTYLETGIVPAGDQSWSVIVRFSDITGDGFFIGGYNNNNSDEFSIWINAPVIAAMNGNCGPGANMPQPTSGVYCMSSILLYRDGVVEPNTIGIGNALAPIPPLFIGAENWLNGSYGPQLFLPGKIQALAIYSCTLTAPQVLAITNAMAAV
jgi:hypothetical protein